MSEKFPMLGSEKATGEFAEKPKEKTILEHLRGRAKKLYLALGIVGALAGQGLESKAYAEEVKNKPEASAIDIKSIRDIETQEGRVFFARTMSRDAEVQGEKGKEIASLIRVFDEGDPKIKGDETEIKAKLYRFQGKKSRSWDTEIESQGQLKTNELGKFEPTKYKEGGNVNMARERARAELRNLYQLNELLKGLSQVGEGKSEEADKLKADLEAGYWKYKKQFPNQILNENDIIVSLGGTPKEPKAQAREEKELDIPGELSAKDMPKSNPF